MGKREYRVVWRRHGHHQKSKRFASLKAAQRRADLLGPEPWKAYNADPDARHCYRSDSSEDGCPCEGGTWREYLLASRVSGTFADDDGMPAIKYIRIEVRDLNPWVPVETTAP